jgi:O-Antigen ligase
VTSPAWLPARRRFSAAELRRAPAAVLPRWPTASIFGLVVAGIVLPAGLLSVLNGLLVLLAVALAMGNALAGQAPDAALRRLLATLAPLLALIAIGIAMGFSRLVEGQAYDFLKDGWYFANPILVFVVGFVFGRAAHAAAGDDSLAQAGVQARGLRAFVLAGATVAVLHLLWFAIHPQLLALDATEVRGITGAGWFAPALALLILLAHRGAWRDGLALPPLGAAVLLALVLASVVLTFSRVLAVVVAVGTLIVFGLLARHGLRRVLLLLVLAALAVGVLRQTLDVESREARTSFLGKFARIPEELTPTDRLHGQDVHDNWRGYETARGMRHWAAGHPGQWLFGDGFGALVDLGRFQQLSPHPREAMRFIPILHNSYVYLLVKTGLVGLALYGWMLWRLYRWGRDGALAHDAGQRRRARLLQAMAVTLALTTGVWSGLFSKFDLLAFMLLTGWLLAQPRSAEAGP